MLFFYDFLVDLVMFFFKFCFDICFFWLVLFLGCKEWLVYFQEGVGRVVMFKREVGFGGIVNCWRQVKGGWSCSWVGDLVILNLFGGCVCVNGCLLVVGLGYFICFGQWKKRGKQYSGCLVRRKFVRFLGQGEWVLCVVVQVQGLV